MISSDIIRGYVDVLVLDSVMDQPSYGYAISKWIEERSGGLYAIKETTLYSAMRRLEESGALESFAGTETHGKARTYYRITPAGRELYRTKCAEWHVTVEVIGRFVREE